MRQICYSCSKDQTVHTSGFLYYKVAIQLAPVSCLTKMKSILHFNPQYLWTDTFSASDLKRMEIAHLYWGQITFTWLECFRDVNESCDVLVGLDVPFKDRILCRFIYWSVAIFCVWLCNARYPMRRQRALLGEIEGDGDRKRKMTTHLIIAPVARLQSNEFPNKLVFLSR